MMRLVGVGGVVDRALTKVRSTLALMGRRWPRPSTRTPAQAMRHRRPARAGRHRFDLRASADTATCRGSDPERRRRSRRRRYRRLRRRHHRLRRHRRARRPSTPSSIACSPRSRRSRKIPGARSSAPSPTWSPKCSKWSRICPTILCVVSPTAQLIFSLAFSGRRSPPLLRWLHGPLMWRLSSRRSSGSATPSPR